MKDKQEILTAISTLASVIDPLLRADKRAVVKLVSNEIAKLVKDLRQ
jgi:hypothetical protein